MNINHYRLELDSYCEEKLQGKGKDKKHGEAKRKVSIHTFKNHMVRKKVRV